MSIEKSKDNMDAITNFIEEKLTAEETIKILYAVLNNIENDLMEHAVDADDYLAEGFSGKARMEQNAADRFDKAHGLLEDATVALKAAIEYQKKVR